MKFGMLPDDPDTTARGLSEFGKELLEWDTTPRDLRDEGEKTLVGYCNSRGHNRNRCMRTMQRDDYKMARRQLSLEKGEVDYKTRAILDVAYEQALKGNPQARKDWMAFYEPTARHLTPAKVDVQVKEEPVPAEAVEPTAMSDEELEAAVKEWANDG